MYKHKRVDYIQMIKGAVFAAPLFLLYRNYVAIYYTAKAYIDLYDIYDIYDIYGEKDEFTYRI